MAFWIGLDPTRSATTLLPLRPVLSSFLKNSRPPGPSSLQTVNPGAQKEKDMKIKPLYDRVLIRRLEGSTTSKGGIIIPDSARKSRLKAK